MKGFWNWKNSPPSPCHQLTKWQIKKNDGDRAASHVQDKASTKGALICRCQKETIAYGAIIYARNG
jgi:hypothetical protein